MQQLGTVLITGAASGIGQALAHRYAPRASRLVLLDLEPPAGTAAELEDSAAEIVTGGADVRDAAAVAAVVRDLVGEAPIDRVIHCAGVQVPTVPIEQVTPESVEFVVGVNLLGTFNVVHAVLPNLRSRSHLAIVASLGGLVANYRYIPYSSSKFGVIGLGETLRMELAPRGIAVQLLCPGEVSTPLVEVELSTGDAVQRQIKLLSGKPISAERAGELLQHGIESGRFMVVVPARARALARLGRLMPTRLRIAFTDLQLRQAKRKAGEPV